LNNVSLKQNISVVKTMFVKPTLVKPKSVKRKFKIKTRTFIFS
jgi:hypothetical protein